MQNDSQIYIDKYAYPIQFLEWHPINFAEVHKPSQTYTVPNTDDTSAGSYTCLVTVNNDESAESDAFQLEATPGIWFISSRKPAFLHVFDIIGNGHISTSSVAINSLDKMLFGKIAICTINSIELRYQVLC